MKAVILAGGFGTRLGNRTYMIPKPMVRIGNRPILWHIMKIFCHFGITEFIICLGYKGEIIKDYFLNYKTNSNDFSINLDNHQLKFHTEYTEENWQVTLVDTGINTLKGGRIKRVAPYLDDNINLLTYGDGVADIDLHSLIRFHQNHGKMVTITGVHPPTRFGVLVEQNNLVQSFQEKPRFSRELINGGFMVFNREMLDYLTPAEDCDFEIGPLEELSKQGEVMVYKHQGSWECMDNERDVEYLNKLWNQDEAFWKVWERRSPGDE